MTGAVPLHRAARVARTLLRIAKVCDVDQQEGYTEILAGAAADPLLSDPDLGKACAKTIHDLLDAEPERDKTAHELRTVTKRRIGDGLTRYTIDAPDEAAAHLDGVLTGDLAKPTPTIDENGQEVADSRRTGARQFDAIMTVLKRGLGNPGAAPSTARSTVIVTIPFDPEQGRPSGTGSTPSGLLLTPTTVGQLACGAEITPVWVGPGNEPLALGRAARYATPGQWKALVVRDEHCTFPGCTRLPQWCDAHHLQWWSRGGATDLTNLALLCQQHHTHVHQNDLVATVINGYVVWHV